MVVVFKIQVRYHQLILILSVNSMIVWCKKSVMKIQQTMQIIKLLKKRVVLKLQISMKIKNFKKYQSNQISLIIIHLFKTNYQRRATNNHFVVIRQEWYVLQITPLIVILVK